ncbi:MAG TPA: hypothetical protein VG456_03435 [Candidatus Sulfopaludibacter sp.]|nr:hypothetical protein [Candidatus Sulfopaludibacter sp.]
MLDATCMDTQKDMKACSATNATTVFLLQVDGKSYRLDQAGNTKAMDALKSRADRSAPNNPNTPNTPAATTGINAKVSGTVEGDTIKVDTIDVQ